MAEKIKLRRDTSTNWATNNPILAEGEPGVEIDTGILKIGDGATAWDTLIGISGGGGEGGGGIPWDDFVTVDGSGDGDYLSPNDAWTAGHKQMYIMDGEYTITGPFGWDMATASNTLQINIIGQSRAKTRFVCDPTAIYSIFEGDWTGRVAPSGTISWTEGDLIVSGISTAFTTEFRVGDYIGKSYLPFGRVTHIFSDTSMLVDRPYNNTSLTNTTYEARRCADLHITNLAFVNDLQTDYTAIFNNPFISPGANYTSIPNQWFTNVLFHYDYIHEDQGGADGRYQTCSFTHPDNFATYGPNNTTYDDCFLTNSLYLYTNSIVTNCVVTGTALTVEDNVRISNTRFLDKDLSTVSSINNTGNNVRVTGCTDVNGRYEQPV
jgi:hypothetical protein